jgi:hypothetical protein
MKMMEIVSDWLADTKLMEMAFERKQIVNKCIDLAHQIDIHMIKVVWFSNSQDVNHWCNELNGWLDLIQDMKYNRKSRLSGQQYYDILFLGYLDSVTQVSNIIKNKIDRGEMDVTYKNELTPHEVYEQLEKIFHAICYDISMGNFSDVKNYLT